jgi:hypothetical protein
LAPWKGHRRNSWASNGNISVYIFCLLFAVWLGFQIWSRLPGGPPPPPGLDPMVMAALGVAVTSKSVEKRAADDSYREKSDDRQSKTEGKVRALEDTRNSRIDDLEDVVSEEHPQNKVKKRPKSGGDDESSD